MKKMCLATGLILGVLCITLPSWGDGPVKPSTDKLYAATWVNGCPTCDDYGPTNEVLRPLYEKSRTNISYVGMGWGDSEKSDPGTGESHYDFSYLDKDPGLASKKVKICWLTISCSWGDKLKETDPARYTLLSERWVTAATKYANSKGIKYFQVPGNEFDMMGRGDWAYLYCEPLKHVYKGVKAAGKDNIVIAGNLSNGIDNTIQTFYDEGAKGNFDVLDIHTYSNDVKTGVDVFQVVAAHRVMERNGDGNKKIFLGEGWGPGRELPTISRKKDTDPITKQEIDDMRSFVLNGYRNMQTQRDIYNPDWLLGARFFTFNDNYGQGQWKAPGRIKYIDENGDGKPDYLILDGYRLPADFNVDPKFFNGGLIAFDGKPKGDLLEVFPGAGYVPVHKITGTLTGNNPGGPYTADTPYTLTIKLDNLTGKEMKIDGTSVSHHSMTWRPMKLQSKLISDMPKSIPANGSAIAKYTVTFPTEAANDEVVVMGEVNYTIGDTPYHTDSWTTVKVAPQVKVALSPARMVLLGNPPTSKVSMSITNNSASALQGEIDLSVSSPVTSSANTFPAKVDSGKSSKCSFTLSVPADTKPGQYPATIKVTGHAKVSQIGATGTYQPNSGEINYAVVNTKAEMPIVAMKASKKITLDSPLSDWNTNSYTIADKDGKSVGTARFTYDETGVYAGIEINDTKHFQHWPATEIWKEDSIQMGIDPLMDGARIPGKDGFRSDDYEYGFAGTEKGPIVSANKVASGKPIGILKTVPFMFKNENGVSTYKIYFPWSELTPFNHAKSNMFALSVLVNMNDGQGRSNAELGGGILNGKNPDKYLPIVLAK